jgi:hypothetical protein
MKLKFNWGTKIAIVYTAFVVFIGGMVYMSFGEKFDLVTEDYYAQEIAYQDKIDSRERLNALEKKIQISIEDQKLNITFPHDKNSKINGKVNCFRPSDETKDFTIKMEEYQGTLGIPLNKFSSGKYTIKLDWKANDKSYFTERVIIIP